MPLLDRVFIAIHSHDFSLLLVVSSSLAQWWQKWLLYAPPNEFNLTACSSDCPCPLQPNHSHLLRQRGAENSILPGISLYQCIKHQQMLNLPLLSVVASLPLSPLSVLLTTIRILLTIDLREVPNKMIFFYYKQRYKTLINTCFIVSDEHYVSLVLRMYGFPVNWQLLAMQSCILGACSLCRCAQGGGSVACSDTRAVGPVDMCSPSAWSAH